ncbi:DNA repair protein [Stenotrophomonas sp.]|uniref:DNA repair protein n=1 Tax=Stenotrophomonas sp. TaxID=69392 RepID=UPI00289E6BC1|nr:DNA repair protein [Stenotrophomonas sp.]
MSSGKFTLFRHDGHGNVVPCAGVTYRIRDVLHGFTIVASGRTDIHGDTDRVILPERAPTPAPPVLPDWRKGWPHPGAGPAGLKLLWPRRNGQDAAAGPGQGVLLPQSEHRYHLQVRDDASGEWTDPLQHPDCRESAQLGPWSEDPQADASMRPALQVRRLRLRPFHQLQLQRQGPPTPVPGAAFVGYRRDSKGAEVIARDVQGQVVRGVTDLQGITPRIFCESDLRLVFTLPGSRSELRSGLSEPRVVGQPRLVPVVPVKMHAVVSGPGEGATLELAGKISAPALLNAADEELLLLTPEVWEEFREVSRSIEGSLSAVPRARWQLEEALAGRSLEAIAQAEKNLGMAEDRAAAMLNGNFARKTDLVEVITFESHSRKGDGEPQQEVGLRRNYLPRFKYDEFKGHRVMGVPTHVDVGVTTRAGDSTMSAGSAARQKGSAFENFDSRKFKESLMTIKGQIGRNVKAPNIQFDLIELGGNQFSDLVRESETYSLETSAQWLRFVAGAGASAQAEWDPLHRKVSAKVEASAHYKLALFEAKAVHTWSIPSRTGWMQRYGDIDLGAIVFQMSLELHGFAGMKRALMGAVGVTIDRGAVKVEAQPRDRDDSFVPSFDIVRGMPRADMGDPPDKDGKPSGRFVMAAVGEKPPKSLNGMQVNAEAFVGVEAGLTPAGELQWLPPQQGKPVTLAKLSLGTAGSAGAGAKAQLYVYYADGRFRIKVSARLCVGIGCRGSLDFVVGVEGMLEFAKWVYYQLAHAGFKELLFFAEGVLEHLSQVVFLLTSTGGSAERFLIQNIDRAKVAVIDQIRQVQIAQNRIELVRRINSSGRGAGPQGAWLVYATPMTRGMLLYAITRHNWTTHMKSPAQVEGVLDPQMHYLPDHKKAVIRVIKGITLVSEWEVMFRHMTEEGEPSSELPGNLEGDVMRFLNYGRSLSDDLKRRIFDPINTEGDAPSEGLGSNYVEQFLAHRRRLLGAFPKGYEVAQLQGMEIDALLALDGRDAPTFASLDGDYLRSSDLEQRSVAIHGRGSSPTNAS